MVDLSQYIVSIRSSALERWSNLEPWNLTRQSVEVVRALLGQLSQRDHVVDGEVAIHRSATVESGAILKGPLIVGAGTLVAAGAYLRGGTWVAENCIVGPGAELKSSFVFAGTRLAHFNFVGDSVLGADVNLEAGSIICNHRNERSTREIRVRIGSELHSIGHDKFGALVGDGARVGANAVIAPGALLPRATFVGRTALCDQDAPA